MDHARAARLFLLVAPLFLAPAADGSEVSTPASVAGALPARPLDARHRSKEEPVFDLVRLRWQSDAHVVRAALSGARRRLQRPECQRILGEFSDPSGQTLGARLASSGLSAEERLSQILFYDGQDRICERSHVMAVTAPGSRVVLICPEFVRRYQDDPGYGQAIILHEVLHSIGLAENPPTSSEITRRVIERCGR
jgi:hypothetical protein